MAPPYLFRIDEIEESDSELGFSPVIGQFTTVSHLWGSELTQPEIYETSGWSESGRTSWKSPSIQHEIYEIPGYLTSGKTSSYEKAFGDYCAGLNFIDERHAKGLGLAIDRQKTRSISIASGKSVKTIGTTKAAFQFQGETQKYHLDFHILPKCLHNVVLGRAFLKLTRTFSDLANHARRLRKRIVQGLRKLRLFFLGDSCPKFIGAVNGVQSSALADSGSTVLILDEEYAQGLGLNILRGSCNRTRLVFADGSKAYTSGIVRGVKWQFGCAGNKEHFLDFHVLRNSPAKVILSDQFLFENEAYSKYEHLLVDDEDTSECDGDLSFFAIDHDPEYQPRQYNNSSIEHMEFLEQMRRNAFEDEVSKIENDLQRVDAEAREEERRRRWEQAHARAVTQAAARPTNPPNSNGLHSGGIPAQNPSPHQQSVNPHTPSGASGSKPSLRLLTRLKFRLKKS